MVRRVFHLILLSVAVSGLVAAAELQGLLTDWNCTQDMVRQGRAKILKERKSCRLADNAQRAAYGLITDDKKFYKIDPRDNDRVLQVLRDSPDKDNLKVVISGDLQGNTIRISTISEL